MSTLIIQQGHCYRRTGATGTVGEQDYATKVAAACMRLLDGRSGWRVNPTLADEWDYAGDAFVAVHCDGSTNPSARGASVGYRTPEGQAFGQAWKRAYANRGWVGFRGDNYTAALSGYYGTRNAVNAGTRRAIIIECGFRTNAQDRAALDGTGGVDRVALAIGDALGITTAPPKQEDDMTPEESRKLTELWDALLPGMANRKSSGVMANYIRRGMVAAESISGELDDTEVRVLAAIKADAADLDVDEVAGALRERLGDEIAESVGRRLLGQAGAQ